MKANQKSVEILNDLVEINNDRIAGYENAIDELKAQDRDLKTIFLDMINKSRSYKMVLSTELNVLGSKAQTDTTTCGKIYRAWMDIKVAFIGHDRKTILSSCEFGEDAAQNVYKMALEDDDLPAHLHSIVSEQKHSLKLAHDQIKALRDQQA